MLEKRYERYHEELRDPRLAALLRDALADDPALAASPGRTNHIMRKVLASGVMPVRRGLPWGVMAWSTSGLATAAALLILAFGGLHLSARHPRAVVAIHPQTGVSVTQKNTSANSVSSPSDFSWFTHDTDTTIAQYPAGDAQQQPSLLADEPADTTPTDAAPVQVAIALGETGSTAYATGDYQMAYEAYEASYAAAPTPHALMGSAKALEQLSDQSLQDGTSGESTGS